MQSLKSVVEKKQKLSSFHLVFLDLIDLERPQKTPLK